MKRRKRSKQAFTWAPAYNISGAMVAHESAKYLRKGGMKPHHDEA